MTIRQAMSAKPQAPYCSRCDREEPTCGKGAEAVVCDICTYAFADNPKAPQAVERLCECGQATLPKSKLCGKCQRLHRRETLRKTRQKATVAPRSTILPEPASGATGPDLRANGPQRPQETP